MAKNLRVFNTLNDYNTAELVKPSVSYVVSNDKVFYDPYISFQGKFKAEYSDGRVFSAHCTSDTILSSGDINPSGYDSSAMTSCTIGSCVTNISGNTFFNCSGLTSIYIPNNVISIGRNAFQYCRSLTSARVPYGITAFNPQLFDGCKSLTNINIPDSVTFIGHNVFIHCENLENIVVPSGVTSIGQGCFWYCYKLKTITIEPEIPPIIDNGGAFDNTIEVFFVPSGSIDAYKTSVYWKQYKNKFQPIPNS